MATEAIKSSLSDHAYTYIQEQLLAGRWGPSEKISEKSLADELGISRTPVREAIRRMIAEGPLYQVPSSGTFVTKPDRQSISEMGEVQMALEGLAAEKAAEVIRAPEVRELQRQFAIMRNARRVFRESGERYMRGELLERFLAADRAMHTTLLSVANNRMVSSIVDNGRIQTSIFGLWSYERDSHHITIALRSHGRLVYAIRQRDGKLARQCMETHIRASMQDALRAYDRQLRDQNLGAQAAVRSLD